ncbi:MAG TPA: hypothetical protein VJY35_15025, partial [Candidatus Eisenbacteria bacterium]|nr:hypothetical protein [Candidatus Eisenbacteria bacterium]
MCPLPTIDGNLGDLTDFARCVDGCGIVQPFDSLNICITGPVIPCATLGTCTFGGLGYYRNGFDLTRAVLAYDRVNSTLYLGYRVAGVIGDADGDGTPGAGVGCPQTPSFTDPPGIGASDNYQWDIDTNCDNVPDFSIEVIGNPGAVTVSINGVASPTATAAYTASGHDIEVKIPNISLPPLFRFSGSIGSNLDGMSEDPFQPLSCAAPDLDIDIVKSANPAVLCPGVTTTITLTITNTSSVPITNVAVTDILPAGLAYVGGSTSGTCGLGEPNVNNQTLTWTGGGPLGLQLAIGQSCTIVFQAERIDLLCKGTVTNLSSAQGLFTSPCFNGGQPVVVGPANFPFDFLCSTPIVTLPPVGPFCIDAVPGTVQLQGTPVGGVYSGDGVDPVTGVFTIATAGVGPHVIRYTYTDPNGCSDFKEITITVNDIPTVTLPGAGPVCIDAVPGTIQLAGTPVGGVYSGDGVDPVTGVFTIVTAGVGPHVIRYTFTDANGCDDFKEITITVNDIPAVTLPDAGPFCIDRVPGTVQL